MRKIENEQPIPPMSSLARRYLILFVIGATFGMVLIFLSALGRYQLRKDGQGHSLGQPSQSTEQTIPGDQTPKAPDGHQP